MVSVFSKATFTWKKKRNSWDEVLTYRLRFDKKAKVEVYDMWGNSDASYIASTGELG